MDIFVAWALYAVLATGLFSGFFLWAVRSRQFSEQERARYLPLLADPAGAKDEDAGREG